MRHFLVLILALFLATILNAQVSFNLNINLDNQPAWGPTGYDYAEYYYLPDIEVYYYIPQHRFYYNRRGHWISSLSLPSRYHNYDLYHSYKVVVNDRDPWRNHKTYREKYSSFKGQHDQLVIRDSRDPKYFVNKNHPQHKNWVQQQRNNNEHNNTNKGNDGNGRSMVNKQNNDRDKHDLHNDKSKGKSRNKIKK
jgi:hypothetical protein